MEETACREKRSKEGKYETFFGYSLDGEGRNKPMHQSDGKDFVQNPFISGMEKRIIIKQNKNSMTVQGGDGFFKNISQSGQDIRQNPLLDRTIRRIRIRQNSPSEMTRLEKDF